MRILCPIIADCLDRAAIHGRPASGIFFRGGRLLEHRRPVILSIHREMLPGLQFAGAAEGADVVIDVVFPFDLVRAQFNFHPLVFRVFALRERPGVSSKAFAVCSFQQKIPTELSLLLVAIVKRYLHPAAGTSGRFFSPYSADGRRDLIARIVDKGI
jgi:hypothetical protein